MITLESVVEVAKFYEYLGILMSAEQHFTEAFAISNKVYGRNHQSTIKMVQTL